MDLEKKRERFGLALCVIVAILTLLLLKVKSPIIMLFISFLIFVSNVLNMKQGITLAMIVIPLSSTISDVLISMPLLFMPAISGGLILNLLFRKKRFIFKINYLLFFTGFTILILFMSLLYQYFTSLNKIINFGMTMFLSFIISVMYLNYSKVNKQFHIALLLSGLVAIVYVFTGETDTNRLQIDGSVRQLSNILGIAVVFIGTTLILNNGELTKKMRIISMIGLFLLGFGLLSTVSRGVILATLLSIFTAILLLFFLQRRANKAISILSKLSALLLSLYLLLYDYIWTKYGVLFEILEKRFSEDNLDSGTGIREYIWTTVLKEFNTIELLFGTGLDGFLFKSYQIGVYYYAHSVFVDTVASGGILCILMLTGVILKNGINALRLKNVFSIVILLFTVLCFFSHGTVFSSLFWIGLAIAIGTNLTYSSKGRVSHRE